MKLQGEFYQKVAYIAFDNKDGSLLINVPLYVKVSEVNKNGMTDMQEGLMHRISEIMIRRYEKQISAFMENLKKEQVKNESGISG
jgi:hypothetical protein